MKRVLVLLVTTMVFSAAGVALAADASGPEVDRAAATFSLDPKKPPSTHPCTGEDGGPYMLLVGVWKGTESDTSPPPGPDWPLSGTLIVRANFTINLTAGAMVTSAHSAKSANSWVLLLSPVWTREENALGESGGLTVPRPECYRRKVCGSFRRPRLPRSSRATGGSCSSGPLFTAPFA